MRGKRASTVDALARTSHIAASVIGAFGIDRWNEFADLFFFAVRYVRYVANFPFAYILVPIFTLLSLREIARR